MPDPNFPHLQLSLQGEFEPYFRSNPNVNPAVQANRQNPRDHADRVRAVIDGMRIADEENQRQRAALNLPPIPSERGFLLRLPEGIDVEAIVRALGSNS